MVPDTHKQFFYEQKHGCCFCCCETNICGSVFNDSTWHLGFNFPNGYYSFRKKYDCATKKEIMTHFTLAIYSLYTFFMSCHISCFIIKKYVSNLFMRSTVK